MKSLILQSFVTAIAGFVLSSPLSYAESVDCGAYSVAEEMKGLGYQVPSPELDTILDPAVSSETWSKAASIASRMADFIITLYPELIGVRFRSIWTTSGLAEEYLNIVCEWVGRPGSGPFVQKYMDLNTVGPLPWIIGTRLKETAIELDSVMTEIRDVCKKSQTHSGSHDPEKFGSDQLLLDFEQRVSDLAKKSTEIESDLVRKFNSTYYSEFCQSVSRVQKNKQRIYKIERRTLRRIEADLRSAKSVFTRQAADELRESLRAAEKEEERVKRKTAR